MNKLNSMGIGPRIAGIIFPLIAVAIFLSFKFNSDFVYFKDKHLVLYYIGLVLIIIGAIMYFFTVPALLKGLKNTKLMTTGTYYLCCNPLYTAILLFIIPGVSFMMNSWPILLTGIVAYVVFKIFIKSEYTEMEKFFGEDFRKYRAETPEFFPFPVRKWFNRNN